MKKVQEDLNIVNNQRINVTKSSMPTLEEYIKVLKPAWESRWLSNRGSVSIDFENKLKQYFNTEHVELFANGHLALEIAIDALNLEGEVITTPYTHCSTIHAIVRTGLTPVFVDVKEDNYTINPDLIEQAITDKTTGIVATHVYGFMCDVEKIQQIAQKHNLKVIYDAAHAFGVQISGVSAANFGDAAMFSTHATKVFHTIEGGIVTYKNPQLFHSMKYILNFGFTSAEEIDYIGTNARMNEFEAAMGVCNLEYIDDEIARRKVVGEQYKERLSRVKGIKLIEPEKNLEWNFAYYPVVFDGYKQNRDEIKVKLEKANIFARKYFYPIVNKASCYETMFGNVHVPVAAHVADCVLTLPMYSDLTREQVNRICDIILE